MKVNTLRMLVGIPRSGKSTIARLFNEKYGWPIVNPDAIRLALHGEAFVPSAEHFVWAIAHNMVDALFLAGHKDVVLDATNTTRKRRDAWLHGQWEKREFYPTNDTADGTLEECLSRNTNPDLEPVIRRMAEQYEPIEDEERS